MNNTKFTLFDLLYDMALDWIKIEKKTKGSIIGNLINHIETKGKLRDAQLKAVIIYLWLKEVGNNEKLSTLIKNGIPFQNNSISLMYSGDGDYVDKPAKRYLNRYLQDVGIKNLDDYLRINIPYEEYEKLIDNLFEDFNYPNYLFSLPMGSGKTFLMATFIYLDLYLLDKIHNEERYAKNFIILAPSARKTAILPALKTIKLFNPKWILPEIDANRLKREIKIEVLDEIPNADKLQNQSPNLAKIVRTTNAHKKANVFILNAEKVIPDSKISVAEFDTLSVTQQTKIKRADEIKDALSKLKNICVFLDEAHHSYSSDKATKKLRQQLDVINKHDNIKCCIGMSGTPYINKTIEFNNKKLKIQDIQDIVYFYPLTSAIGNFLKSPTIKKVDGNERLLIKSALDDFFEKYDKQYDNGTLSKIAFYCPSIAKLNDEILPIIHEWYDENNRDKNEILKFYTNTTKSGRENYPIPKENEIHFLNLDNPTSKFRVVLLVGIGTEGWDCKSLTSVVLPRHDNGKVLVLQTTCRCLREVVDASNEEALIYLDGTNYDILDNELSVNYHLHISDINGTNEKYKEYPVYQIKNDIGKITYYNVYTKYKETNKESIKNNYKYLLKNYNFDDFKKLYPFTNQIGITTISEDGLNSHLIYQNIKTGKYEFLYTYVDFIYELEKASFGLISCSELMKYDNELKQIYEEISKEKNISWIVNHPIISTYDVCKNIITIFTEKIMCDKEIITEKVETNILNWDMNEKPVVKIQEEDKLLVFPENAYDDIEESIYYEDNLKEIKRRFEDKMKLPNKEKSFNYLPYKFDSMYEMSFLKNVLRNITNLDIEVYYNGHKNRQLERLYIITPYGKYTPDFLILKRDNQNNISKVMLVETKGQPFETEAKEKFIKNDFLMHNLNFSYLKVGDTDNDINEYNKMVDAITEFAK